jgi:5-methylcytosine-specific restriction endonuclease McrA
MANGVNGSTREWRKVRAEVIRDEPLCWLRLPGCTLRSTTADHIIPVITAPHLRMIRSNLHGACKSCNYRRGNTPVARLHELRCKTLQLTRDQALKHIVAQRNPAPALRFFDA